MLTRFTSDLSLLTFPLNTDQDAQLNPDMCFTLSYILLSHVVGVTRCVRVQGLYTATSDIIKHLKQQFPPHTQHAKVSAASLTPDY